MTRLYMLDTNTVSYIVLGSSPAARTRLASLPSGHVACLSSIVEAELRYGLAKSAHREKLCASTEWFLARLKVLPWERDEARVYGQLRVNQESFGKALAKMDMLIAAHALAASATLITRDKAFSHVPDLSSENWATDL